MFSQHWETKLVVFCSMCLLILQVDAAPLQRCLLDLLPQVTSNPTLLSPALRLALVKLLLNNLIITIIFSHWLWTDNMLTMIKHLIMVVITILSHEVWIVNSYVWVSDLHPGWVEVDRFRIELIILNNILIFHMCLGEPLMFKRNINILGLRCASLRLPR